MRVIGWIRIAVVMVLDSIFVYEFIGAEGAAVTIMGILLYAWAGEKIDLLKDGAVSIRELDEFERTRMECLKEYLIEDVRRTSNVDISGIRMHIVPSNITNAFTYGFGNIAVTRAAFDNCDDATLCAVLAHEISHLLYLDTVFRRIMFANITILFFGLSLSCMISMFFLVLIFFALAILFSFFRGVFGIFLFRGIGNAVKGIYSIVQYGVLFIYKTVMGMVSRNSEYRADSFSCRLGYGQQLQYFLKRFIDQEEQGSRSLHEIIYASHPPVYKRIARIEQQISSTISDRRNA